MSRPLSTSLLGTAVREARLANGWSKEEAARRAGISSTTWKRVEDDEPVQDHKLRQVADTLGWEPGRAFQLKAGLADEPPTPDPDVTDEDLLEAISDARRRLAEIEAQIRTRGGIRQPHDSRR